MAIHKQYPEAHRRWLEKRLTLIYKVKSEKGCQRCGNRNPIVLDFHHRDPSEKELGIREFEGCSLSRFQAEVAKCDVLCANCHRIVEYEIKTNRLRGQAIQESRINYLRSLMSLFRLVFSNKYKYHLP